MIVHKIQLRGFLSHRGTPDPSQKGGYAFTELDFSRSSLWLIHGQNGSGKSTIFDAIYFALYKRARGKGEGGQNHGYLIHHEADRAEVRLFLEIGGRKFRVERAIKRGKEANKATADSAVYEGWGDGAKMVDSTKNKAEVWARNALRMDADTFAYAVLLRQGDTDKFLRADPADRKSCLLQLLDLGEFEKLGDAADKAHTWAKRDASEAESRLKISEVLAPDALENALSATKSAQDLVDAHHKTVELTSLALSNGTQIARWRSRIQDLEAENAEQTQLLTRETEIRQAAKRYRDLVIALPIFQKIWEAKGRVEEEEEHLGKTEIHERETQLTRNDLKCKLDAALQDAKTAQQDLAQAQVNFEEAEKYTKNAQGEAQKLAEIEAAEAEIVSHRSKLNQYLQWLNHSSDIEADYKRLNWLNARLGPLETLFEASHNQVKAEEELEKAKNEAEKSQGQFELASSQRKESEGALEALRTQIKNAEVEANELSIRFEQLKARSELRKSVEGVEECQYCGSSLCDETTSQRLKEEREKWNREGTELKTNRDRQNLFLQELKGEEEKALRKFQEDDQSARKAELRAQTAKNNATHAEGEASKAYQSVQRANEKCDGFAHELENLAELQVEVLSLDNAEAEKQKLAEAQSVELAVRSACEFHERQLASLPILSPSERATIKERVFSSKAKLTSCETQLNKANQTLETKDASVNDLSSQLQIVDVELTSVQRQASELRGRVERERSAVGKATDELDRYENWSDHLGSKIQSEFAALIDEQNELKNAENEEDALLEAQKNAGVALGEIKNLQSQIEALPLEHRREVSELEQEHASAESALAEAKDNHINCANEERRIAGLALERQTREKDLQDAEKNADIAKKLAEALGKTGLQATIQQRAQTKLKAEANKVLGRLTKNEWSLHLEEKSDNRLEIWGTDHRNERHVQFEYVSGGERMRIAVALAVAIGQSVTGGSPVRSLIIDEGFGALDGPNRERMVSELQRLSQDEFGGGRVIVISHQDDVCESFTHRFNVERDGNGDVTATPFPNLSTA